MEKTPRTILFLLLLLLGDLGVAQDTTSKADEFHVGVILNLGSLVGKVARTSISLAVEDFYAAHRNYSTKLVLHVRDSMGNDIQAASAGMCLAGYPQGRRAPDEFLHPWRRRVIERLARHAEESLRWQADDGGSGARR